MRLSGLLKICCFWLLVLPFSIGAQESSATQRLNQFVKEVSTFRAHFDQAVLDTQGNLIDQAEGSFVLDRPGKFRWDYQQPYEQQIIADGQRIWFYDIDLEQVTVKSQLEALADTPANLLSGEMLPEDKYLMTDVPSEDGLLWLELIPKDVESGFQTIALAFDEHSLRQMIMKDNFDQRTRLVFSRVEENPQLAEDLFNFTPPQGVDVVGESQE